MGEPVRILLFHDPVCVWSFLSAVRLRRVAAAFGDRVTLAGKVFLLARDEIEALRRWPDHGARTEAILAEWARAKAQPGGEAIDPERARRRLARMPLSLPAAAAVKGAEEIAGMAAHLVLLRRLQEALFVEGRDTSEPGVILQCASAVGLDTTPLAVGLEQGAFLPDAFADDAGARALGFTTVPTVVFDERFVLAGVADEARYRDVVSALLDGREPEGCLDLDAAERSPAS
ncbi:MAG TPA: DsbA family protein [Thermodesulfobacteriota bacterium]